MYPGTFAKTDPDRPAQIMANTGAIKTYRELNDDSMRLANLWRSLGIGAGRKRRTLPGESPRVLDGVLVGAALLHALHRDQLPPHPQRRWSTSCATAMPARS